MGTIPIGMTHAEEDLQQMFELFPRLKERRNQRAMTMSGGEQQMLAIARALMSRPKILLLDEPSLGLAPIIVKHIFQTLRELAKGGMTIFLVEQNANHALKLSDRAYVMVNGEIRMTGTGRELLEDPQVRNQTILLIELTLRPVFSRNNCTQHRGIGTFQLVDLMLVFLQTCQRAYVIDGGRIALEGPAEELLHNEQVQKAYLGE